MLLKKLLILWTREKVKARKFIFEYIVLSNRLYTINNVNSKANKRKEIKMEELIEEVEQLMENGAGIIEIFEYIQDNTDIDPAIIIEKLV